MVTIKAGKTRTATALDQHGKPIVPAAGTSIEWNVFPEGGVQLAPIGDGTTCDVTSFAPMLQEIKAKYHDVEVMIAVETLAAEVPVPEKPVLTSISFSEEFDA